MLPMFRQTMGAPEGDEALWLAAKFNYVPPDLDRDRFTAALDALEAADAWGGIRRTIEEAVHVIAAEGRSPLVARVECTLMLGNPEDEVFMTQLQGYTGAGGQPGAVEIVIWPTDYNLPRLPALVAHEFHHNVRFSYAPWRPDTSVAEYIVAEGLAESFAAALCGEELLGPWVSGLTAEEMEHARHVIGDALDVTGFDKIRGYIFGDDGADQWRYEPVGLPYLAGYATSYQVVQAFLRRSGRSIVEATFTPAEEIVAASGYFG
jgi:uncharacterized protein YjaZ